MSDYTFAYALTDNSDLNMHLMESGGEALNRLADFLKEKEPEAGDGPWVFECPLGDRWRLIVKTGIINGDFSLLAAGVFTKPGLAPSLQDEATLINMQIVPPEPSTKLMHRLILGQTGIPHIDALLRGPQAERLMDRLHASFQRFVELTANRTLSLSMGLDPQHDLLIYVSQKPREKEGAVLSIALSINDPSDQRIPVPVDILPLS